MQSAPATLLPVPDIDTPEPVAVIPTASVAPLDGPPDGERINSFTLAPAGQPRQSLEDSAVHALGEIHDLVLSRPLTCLVVAFGLGFVLARARR